MKVSIYKKIRKHLKSNCPKGFILPFTMLISTLVLMVAGSAMTLLSKQLYFSRVYKQSQVAYYAADDALACALQIDDSYVGPDGLGIFPSSTTTSANSYIDGVFTYVKTARGLAAASKNDIECAQVPIFDTAVTAFATSTNFYQYTPPVGPVEKGVTSVYSMRMPLGDGTFRCAKVTVNKTATFRQVISQGYAKCDTANGSIERAVVNTTISG